MLCQHMPGSAPATLTPELLYEIIGRVIARYIDDFLAGPLKYKGQRRDEVDGHPKQPDTSLFDVTKNPCMALLQASYQVRQVTLSLLSQALQIDFEPTGAGRLACCPWECLHGVRALILRTESDQRQLACAIDLFKGSIGSKSMLLCSYVAVADVHKATAELVSLLGVLPPELDVPSPAVNAWLWMPRFNIALLTLAEASTVDVDKPRIPEVLYETVARRVQVATVEGHNCGNIHITCYSLRGFLASWSFLEALGHDSTALLYNELFTDIFETLKVLENQMRSLADAISDVDDVPSFALTDNTILMTCTKIAQVPCIPTIDMERHREMVERAQRLLEGIAGCDI